MKKTLYDIRKLIGLPRVELAKRGNLSHAQLRNMELKDVLDLSIKEIISYAECLQVPYRTLIREYIGLEDWPDEKIRFWNIIETTYRPSAKRTRDMLKEIYKDGKIPSYPTMHRWINKPMHGYLLIPIRYLYTMHKKRLGLEDPR